MQSYNPYKARQAKKRKRKPGALQDLVTILWGAVLDVQAILDGCAGDPEQTLRAAHCLSQVAGQYSRLLEVGEFEAQLAALEAAQKGR
jgi:hypothetical protein